MSNRKSKKQIAIKNSKKGRRYPSKEENFFMPFDELCLSHIEEKFGFKTIKLIGDILYITTYNGEEFFIEAIWNDRIQDYVSTLHHKNTKHNRDEYHEELKYFSNIFMIFGYIRHHEHKPFDAKKSPQVREMDKMSRLFAQISS